MSANLPTASAPTPPTYPHIGAICVAAGSALLAFSETSGPALPANWRGGLVGVGSALVTAGGYFLGHAVGTNAAAP
jgi:hypothetical protein